MIRVILTQLVLFLLPFIAFAVYRLAMGGVAGIRVTDWSRVSFALVMVGFAFVIAGFVFFAVSGREPTGTYIPTQFEDGQLVPGRFIND